MNASAYCLENISKVQFNEGRTQLEPRAILAEEMELRVWEGQGRESAQDGVLEKGLQLGAPGALQWAPLKYSVGY